MEFVYFLLTLAGVLWLLFSFITESVIMPPPLKRALMPSYRLSDEANWVKYAWTEIPKDQRPEDPTPVLKLLDARYGFETKDPWTGASGHHFSRGIDNCNCDYWSTNPCKKYPEYRQMRKSFESITKEITRREKALAKKAREEGFTAGQADVTLYLDRLRDEADIQRQVTKELM